MLANPKIKKISLIIPVYNEEKIVKDKLEKITSQKWASGYRREILVIDDGSTDNTASLVKDFSKKHKEIRLVNMGRNEGKGAAIKRGIEIATGEFVIFSDIDLSVPLGTTEKFIRAFKDGYEVIIATRRKRGAKIVKRQPLARQALGKGFTWMTKILLDVHVSDFTCGFKGFKTEVAKKVFEKVRIKRWAFDAEAIFIAAKMGSRIKEIPVVWRNREDSRVNLRKDICQSLTDTLSIRLNDLRGFYGKNSTSWLTLLPFSNFIFTGERLSIDDTHGINQARYEFALGFTKKMKVLELGCAFGYGSLILAKGGAEMITAIDSSKKAISYAKQNFKHKKISYKVARIENLKPGKKYGAVIAFEIIEHLKEPDILLSYAKLSLGKGGHLILSTPNRLLSSYDGNRPTNPYHVKEYYPQELRNLLKSYFLNIELYGIFLRKKKRQEEKEVQQSLRWKFASYLVRKRWLRRIINFIPSGPKRIFTREKVLNFKPEDFEFRKSSLEDAPYLIAVCCL